MGPSLSLAQFPAKSSLCAVDLLVSQSLPILWTPRQLVILVLRRANTTIPPASVKPFTETTACYSAHIAWLSRYTSANFLRSSPPHRNQTPKVSKHSTEIYQSLTTLNCLSKNGGSRGPPANLHGHGPCIGEGRYHLRVWQRGESHFIPRPLFGLGFQPPRRG